MSNHEPYPWGTNRRFNSYSDHIKNLFGGRVQKVAVNAGFTCPNRDGTLGTGGCTFCDNEAFNPSYCQPAKSLHQQIREGIEFHAFRYRRAKKYLVYFQPYSNTYAPLETLIDKFGEALEYPGVIGLVIGTRPDCVDDPKLNFLAHLSRHKYIQVEYGIETVSELTLERINRGHSFELSRQIVTKTKSMGIKTGAHFIFGLPGESLEEMLESASVISRLPIDTVKFHQLQIIKGTPMEREFHRHPRAFHVFSLDGYIDFIIRFIERLNPLIVIERFTGEVPPRFIENNNLGLLRYDQVLGLIEKELERRNTWQGKYFS